MAPAGAKRQQIGPQASYVIVAELDVIEVKLIMGRIMAVRLKITRLEKKFENLSKSKKTIRSLSFLTFGAKLAFTKLRQVFFKSQILHHFNPEPHIRIETDTSSYAIGAILSQLILNDSG